MYLSDEKSFQQVMNICHDIERYLGERLEINAEKTLSKYFAAAAVVLLVGVAAFMTGPGLLLIGVAAPAVAIGVGAAAGVIGAGGAGFAASRYFRDTLVDENYTNVLKFLVNEMLKMYRKQ